VTGTQTGWLASSTESPWRCGVRRSGRTICFPLVMAMVGGEHYLVSMLGQNANWVRNVRAAGGDAILRHGLR
jgi:hypothetical protein